MADNKNKDERLIMNRIDLSIYKRFVPEFRLIYSTYIVALCATADGDELEGYEAE